MRSFRFSRKFLAPVLIAICCLIPAMAQDNTDDATGKEKSERKQDRKKSPLTAAMGGGKKGDEVPTFTNEDLERMFGGRAAPRPEPTPGTETEGAQKTAGDAANPLDQMMKQQKAEAERRNARAEAEIKVQELEQRVQDLEKRLLATRNPLLPRPPISEEEQAEWSQMSAPERVNLTEEELNKAREELAQARAQLSSLR